MEDLNQISPKAYGLAVTEEEDDDDDEGLCQKYRVKLIFRGTWLSRTWIVECLKIIDVGCNLK